MPGEKVCIARLSPAAIRATSISSDEACAVACAGTATAAERGRREVLIILKSPDVASREIKAGTGKSFLDLFCSVNGTT